MPIFKKEKTEKGKEIKLFGLVLYRALASPNSKVRSFLGNFVSIEKIDEGDIEIKKIKFFDKEFSKTELSCTFKKKYYFGRLFKTWNPIELFNRKYSKLFKDYDKIILLNSNSGEFYLFLTYIFKSFLTKNKYEKVLLVLTKKYHVDLVKLIPSQVPYVYIKKPIILKDMVATFDSKTFYTFFHRNYFLKVEYDMKTKPIGEVHYFKSLMDITKVGADELSFSAMTAPEGLDLEVQAKAELMGLNLDKFVFVAPEAMSCDVCDNGFWLALSKALEDLGYDVFMNIAFDNVNLEGVKYKTCHLSFSQAFALAKKSKGVVSLRSGLTECLLQAKVPSFVLYTGLRNRYIFNDMDVDHVYAGFTLSVLPNVNKDLLFEYKVNEFSKEEIIKDIIGHLYE